MPPLLNAGTREALRASLTGYAGREAYSAERIEALRTQLGIDTILRFDLGHNCDGCSPKVAERLARWLSDSDSTELLKRYPPSCDLELQARIARLHDIEPEWVLFSAGVEQMLGLIAASFLDVDDRVSVCLPSFYQFENYARRMGATPVYLHLREEDGFNWTRRTVEEFEKVLSRLRLKVVWLASPNNPTGQVIPPQLIPEIVELARRHHTFVVFDEAYAEYTDPPNAVTSASALLHQHDNLIVLRTFSKAYGLANMRVGYAMCSNAQVRRAVALQGYAFPITQLTYELARAALADLAHLEQTRRNTRRRMAAFQAAIAELPHLSMIDTDCSIFMLRHSRLQAAELHAQLEQRGLLLSRIPGNSDVSKRYLRVSLGREDDDARLLEALAQLE